MSVYLGANNIVSPLGFTTKENIHALLQGKVAVKKQLFSFSESPFCCSKIEEEVLNNYFSSLSVIDEYTQLEKMCILSINDVVQQSGIDLRSSENLLIISTTKGNIDVLEDRYKTMDYNRAYLSVFAKKVGDYFGCVNSPLVVSNACISGLLAMIIAKRFIEDRIGINLGEAASSVLLSGDKISTIKISAGNSSNDANHISGPSRTGEGLYKAVKETLADANLEKVDFISAHGTATEFNDEMESIAFTRAGINHSPLNSLKGYYGHTLGAAGVLESVISIQSLLSDTLLKSMGFELSGTSEKLNVIKNTEQQSLKSFLKTASGFGGCNAAALFEKE